MVGRLLVLKTNKFTLSSQMHECVSEIKKQTEEKAKINGICLVTV